MPTGIDESWGRADWATLAKNGVQVVSLYLSRDPSKNAKPADIKAAHSHGIAIILNWESQAGAPLNGSQQGTRDARDWLSQKNALVKAVGYGPKNKLGAYFSCDRDTVPADYLRIDQYYGATKAELAGAALNGVYGEKALIEHLHNAGLTACEWQTYAWSGGVQSPQADFFQYKNGQNLGGASVDFDSVVHPAQLGAWWPPGHHFDAVSPTATVPPKAPAPSLLEVLVSLDRNSADYKAFIADIAKLVNSPSWKSASDGYKVGYSPDTVIRKAVIDDAGAAVAGLKKDVAAVAKVAGDADVRIAALQAAVAKLSADLKSGTVNVKSTSFPVTGTVTIGASK